MFEKIGQNLRSFQEKVVNSWSGGVDKLKATLGKVRENWSVFSEESKISLTAMIQPVTEKIGEGREVVSQAYQQGERKNIWQRLVNVGREVGTRVAEGWKEIKTRASTKLKDIRERYQGLGIGGTIGQAVVDAISAVEELPVTITTGLQKFEEAKIDVAANMAKNLVEKDTGKPLDPDSGDSIVLSEGAQQKIELLAKVFGRIAEKRNNFAGKVESQNRWLKNVRERRAELAKARIGVRELVV